MILIDEITNEHAHLIQMRVEDFATLLAQHRESIDNARRVLEERSVALERMRVEAMELRRKLDGSMANARKDADEMRDALGALLQIARPKGIQEKETVSAAQRLFSDTAPIPF